MWYVEFYQEEVWVRSSVPSKDWLEANFKAGYYSGHYGIMTRLVFIAPNESFSWQKEGF
jgi:hypothetical protein